MEAAVRSSLDAAHRAAETAADIAAEAARGYFRRSLGVEFKSDDSPVTEADRGIETKVRAFLRSEFPDHAILGEEHGIDGAGSRAMWIIDPIDGTRSFLSGNPLFGFLLGHLVDGVAEIGVVAMPALNETFIGRRGQGATLQGQPITASDQRQLDQAILYVNEGDKIYRDHPDLFGRLMGAGQTRRLAYDCYPHALVAMGHVDAVVDYDLQPYDYLPVSALVEAAGGVMTDWHGAPLTLASDGRVVSAATPALHENLLTLIGA